jgi:GTP cyclohydrolase II
LEKDMSFESVTTRAIYPSEPARLPTALGEFVITVYRDQERKEHLAVRMGDVDGPPILVRIHSECLTGDVFGSLRCDCGEQLQAALRFISQEGRGLFLYLRQEGRGIGLNNKIRAYALQDQGMDTVEANLYLGFPADGRSYADAAAILKDQGVHSVRLATNNPEKVKALEACGIQVVERVRYEIQPRPENYSYLQTKAAKLGHLLTPLPGVEPPHVAALTRQRPSAMPLAPAPAPQTRSIVAQLRERLREAEFSRRQDGIPWVTLSYAQSLDGSIAAAMPGKRLQLSNPHSQALTHQLRSMHDAILVGINTVLTDDPQLTVRLVKGKNPQPVVLDGRLRLPLGAKLLRPPCVAPIVATTAKASAAREKRLRAAGARVIRVRSRRNGLLDLRMLLAHLHELGIRSLMVEGGASVITAFLAAQLVDQMIVTIAPRVVGGLNAVMPFAPRMRSRIDGGLMNVQYHVFDGDLVVYADMNKPPFNRRPAAPLASPCKETRLDSSSRAML